MTAAKQDGPIQAVAPPTGRLWAGVSVFALGWILALTMVPFVTSSDFPTSVKATLTTLLVVVVPKVFLLAAIAILGKPGFAYLKSVAWKFFRRIAPPPQVGVWRYRIGLVMFFLPLFFSLFFQYFQPIFEGGAEARPTFERVGDIIQIVALFVLGGDFWDKLRALFVRDAKAVFPEKAPAS